MVITALDGNLDPISIQISLKRTPSLEIQRADDGHFGLGAPAGLSSACGVASVSIAHC